MISAEIMGKWQSLDASHMLRNVLQAPTRGKAHFQKGLDHGFPSTAVPQHILICGMGGSGSTGDFFQALCADATVPIWVHKTPDLPAWVNAHTLVICVSYSGNTAETLGCVEQAQARGAMLHLLSSGGRLLELAQAQGLSYVPLDGGLPPRAALFDMLFALLGSMVHLPYLHLDRAQLEQGLQQAQQLSQTWNIHPQQEQPLPLQLAQHMQGETLHIWGRSGGADTLAIRWKNQLAENAKVLSFAAVLPELNHNEIVPLCHTPHTERAVVYLSLDPEISPFDAISLDLAGEYIGETHRICAEGETFTARLLYLLYLADFVSVYLAYLQCVDPTPIAPIDALKQRMEALS